MADVALFYLNELKLPRLHVMFFIMVYFKTTTGGNFLHLLVLNYLILLTVADVSVFFPYVKFSYKIRRKRWSGVGCGRACVGLG